MSDSIIDGLHAGTAQSRYRTIVFNDPDRALGIACRLMLGQPAFALLPFGTWVGVLAAQSRRRHVRFFIDNADRVLGFFGYALAPLAEAHAWAFAEACIGDGLSGDCLIVNAWVAADKRVVAFMCKEMRRVAHDKKAIYYKRFYPDGRARPCVFLCVILVSFRGSYRALSAYGRCPSAPRLARFDHHPMPDMLPGNMR